MELQVSDVFLRELMPEYSSSEVVIDIGSNTGKIRIIFFSLSLKQLD